MPEQDPLEGIVAAAHAEGALGPEGLAAFAEALRERARLVLAERLRTLEEHLAALGKETAWRADENRRLKEEREALGAEWEKARAAHDRLLAHHHGVLRHVVETLEACSAALPWSFRRARARLAETAASLRKELG